MKNPINANDVKLKIHSILFIIFVNLLTNNRSNCRRPLTQFLRVKLLIPSHFWFTTTWSTVSEQEIELK